MSSMPQFEYFGLVEKKCISFESRSLLRLAVNRKRKGESI